jgi:UDP-GlcNAc:undecaprenyl-phosphate GlcNAc-1-phosphate transferase
MVYLSAFIFALIGTAIFTPVSIRIARRFDVLDYPRARNVHRQPLPRWGGIGIYTGFFLALTALFLLFPSFRALLSFKCGVLKTQLAGIVFGSTLVFILGLIDDKKSIRAVSKLLTQIIAAYVAMDYGVRISGLALPFVSHYYDFPKLLGQLLTVFWIIGFMNTINLADGLDGLAAGIVAIASGTFFVVALLQGESKVILLSKQLLLASILACALLGVCIGFLLYNFHPAKVFMGDSGALFLGFMLAVISTIGTLKTTAVMALFIPITVVALPILDVALSIFRRMRQGMGLMQPDKDHIHHRLLRFGWSHREVVLLMYVFTLVLSIVSILLTVFKAKV